MTPAFPLRFLARRALVGWCLAFSLAIASFPARTGNPPLTVQANAADEQKTKRSMAQAKQVALALTLYASDNDEAYPATPDALSPAYINADGMRKLLVSPFVPTEPVGYQYTPD